MTAWDLKGLHLNCMPTRYEGDPPSCDLCEQPAILTYGEEDRSQRFWRLFRDMTTHRRCIAHVPTRFLKGLNP